MIIKNNKNDCDLDLTQAQFNLEMKLHQLDLMKKTNLFNRDLYYRLVDFLEFHKFDAFDLNLKIAKLQIEVNKINKLLHHE